MEGGRGATAPWMALLSTAPWIQALAPQPEQAEQRAVLSKSIRLSPDGRESLPPTNSCPVFGPQGGRDKICAMLLVSSRCCFLCDCPALKLISVAEVFALC